jgi:hypothetical protein
VLLESECSTQEIADATGVEKVRFSQKAVLREKILLPEHVARAIERSRVTPRTQTRGQLYEREAREDRACSDCAYDLLDDAVPAFHKQPAEGVPEKTYSGRNGQKQRD